MTNHEHERQPEPLFGKEPYTKKLWGNGPEHTFQRVTVNSEALEGFDETILPKEAVASILFRTIDGMKDHGASALGLDLDSMMGTIHASGHIKAAMDVGANILNDLAPRTDGVTWHEWVAAEFPNAVAAVHGAGSSAVQLAHEEMAR